MLTSPGAVGRCRRSLEAAAIVVHAEADLVVSERHVTATWLAAACLVTLCAGLAEGDRKAVVCAS